MEKTRDEWEHMFKLDPAKEISADGLAAICKSGTDAVIVGGSDDVTFRGVLDLLAGISRYRVPCVLEVSGTDMMVPGFDYYLIPMMLNSTEKKWMMDMQHAAIKTYKDMLDGQALLAEGYCVLNEEAKVFQKTNCRLPDADDVVAYAYMAEYMFHLPVFYMEYSGKYGDPTLVKRVKAELNHTRLFYGGGITGPNEAKEMKEHADAIIVGNSIYTDLDEALKTVEAVQ